MRYRLDRATRVLDGGRAVLGGSPLRFFRLTERGAAELGRVAAAGGDWQPTDRAVAALARRLADAGAVHPVPDAATAPFSVADVTVVVPVADRPQELARCLAALAAARGSDGPRVVVVDDHSVDGAAIAAVAAGAGATLLRRLSRGGPAAARNDGLRAVSSPVVAFVDSDVEVRARWLEPLLAHFAEDRVAVVAPRIGGPAPARAASRLERYEAARSPLDLGPDPAPVIAGSRVSYVPAATLVARVGPLVALGGFDESLAVGEDVDLVWRVHEAGHVVRYEPSVVVTHHHRVELAAWWRRRRDYGTSAALLDERHPGAVAPLSVSGWSVAVWVALATGHPVVATGLVGWTAVALDSKLSFLSRSAERHLLALRLVAGGHVGAGRLLGHALIRPWWPLTLIAAVRSPRARRMALVAVVVPALAEWVARRPDLDPPTWVALRLADDVAYSEGVWRGALSRRRIGSLVPRLTEWPGRVAFLNGRPRRS